MSDQKRTDEEIGRLLYGAGSQEKPPEGTGEGGETAERKGQKTSVGDRSLEEIAATFYPEKSPRYAEVSDDGKVADVIRDTDGNILHGGEGGRSYGDIRSMIQVNARQLENAYLPDLAFGNKDLPNAKLTGADLSKSSFHGSLRGSDLSNTKLFGTSFKDADLRFCDLRQAQTDSETDLENADLTGAEYDYSAIKRCRNWNKAKGLKFNSR